MNLGTLLNFFLISISMTSSLKAMDLEQESDSYKMDLANIHKCHRNDSYDAAKRLWKTLQENKLIFIDEFACQPEHTVLHQAYRNECFDCVKIILDEALGASHQPETPKRFSSKKKNCSYPLFYPMNEFARNEHCLKIVHEYHGTDGYDKAKSAWRELLTAEQKPVYKFTCKLGWTVLHTACRNGCLKCVKIILEVAHASRHTQELIKCTTSHGLDAEYLLTHNDFPNKRDAILTELNKYKQYYAFSSSLQRPLTPRPIRTQLQEQYTTPHDFPAHLKKQNSAPEGFLPPPLIKQYSAPADFPTRLKKQNS